MVAQYICHIGSFSCISYILKILKICISLKYQKGTHLCKASTISLPIMQKTCQDHGHSINNGLLNLGDNFCHACKAHEYGLSCHNVLVPCILNFGI